MSGGPSYSRPSGRTDQIGSCQRCFFSQLRRTGSKLLMGFSCRNSTFFHPGSASKEQLWLLFHHALRRRHDAYCSVPTNETRARSWYFRCSTVTTLTKSTDVFSISTSLRYHDVVITNINSTVRRVCVMECHT